jgi:hypothetical protein
MSRSRLRPLDLALQIGATFTLADINGDGQVSAVDKPQERIDGSPGPRYREWWHHYEYAFTEYQPIDLIVLAVDSHNRIFSRYYRRRVRLTARLIYGSFDEDGDFTPASDNGSPVYEWLTLAQAEHAAALRTDLERNQEGEQHKVVSSRGGKHDAMIDSLEYQIQAPKNWKVTDW